MKPTLRRLMFAAISIYICAVSVFAKDLIPVGRVIGLELSAGTVTIAAFEDSMEVGRASGLQIGDTIVAIDERTIQCAEDVRQALRSSDGRVDLKLLRSGEEKTVQIQPEITADGPKLGIYLKQGITGIGTVTFYDPETKHFGALGHGVSDNRGALLNLSRGNAYPASIVSVQKGKVGAPGQLKGALKSNHLLGKLTGNTHQGIFGTASTGWEGAAIPMATAEEVRTGDAVIRSTVQDGEPKEYSVKILKIYPKNRPDGRNLLLEITDPALLDATGGIIQGMSGSPIIQDGKLIGAVTHVLVNDPTRGYGIFIENMLDAAG